jgi:4-hydroxy-4-methyl-2-oxoglutarate aldolase
VLVLPREEVRAVAEEAIARQRRGADREQQVRAGAKLGELSGATAKVLARLQSG